MLKNRIAIILAAALALAPVPLLAQVTGGSAPPPQPGARAAPSNGVGGSVIPNQASTRFAPSSGSSAGSAAPAAPGELGTSGNLNNQTKR
ncbi:hypothetical protein [Bradyrhizobium sp. USDA 3364]